MTAEAPPWIWDDPSITAETSLLRRVPRQPSVLIQDPATLQYELKHEAFIYDHGSGLSVLVADNGAPLASMQWATHGCALFRVRVVRSDVSGVVRDPTPTEPSHGLVRVKGDAAGRADRRTHWLPLRSRIRECALYCDDESSASQWLRNLPDDNA